MLDIDWVPGLVCASVSRRMNPPSDLVSSLWSTFTELKSCLRKMRGCNQREYQRISEAVESMDLLEWV